MKKYKKQKKLYLSDDVRAELSRQSNILMWPQSTVADIMLRKALRENKERVEQVIALVQGDDDDQPL
tara:strand:+ start:1082 stop:1282 length:201 start_codon:yes stop_codon:yes gene_type:complete